MSRLDTPTLLEAARAGDNDACERLLLDNSGLVWSVARRYYGRGVEPEDLYQLGCLGFLKAVRGFDPAYGTQFSTYAVPKIAGEIRRYLRDDGAVKVSRTVKERAAALSQARQTLSQRLGRDPTLSELAEATGTEIEDIAAADTEAMIRQDAITAAAIPLRFIPRPYIPVLQQRISGSPSLPCRRSLRLRYPFRG